MAQKTVAARLEGDNYQYVWFWIQASALLDTTANVCKVTLEADDAVFVDDVKVEYDPPGVNIAGKDCLCDFYQVKYHVDRRATYSHKSLCEPAQAGGKSLLKKFYLSYQKLKDGGFWFRLILISNWEWDQTDPLFQSLRESEEGALPEEFITDRSAKFKLIRRDWKIHLDNQCEVEFADFLSRLRLKVNFLGRGGMTELLSSSLKNVGLKPLDPKCQQNVYTSLAQQLLMTNQTSFSRQNFREMCTREGLIQCKNDLQSPRVIGIRSFIKFAETMEQECSTYVCVAEFFQDGRIVGLNDWAAIYKRVSDFLANQPVRIQEHYILLECNLSLAFLAGYCLPIKSGAKVYPVQKGQATEVWVPQSRNLICADPKLLWQIDAHKISATAGGIAFAVSVTRDTVDQCKQFIINTGDCSHLIHLRPVAGIGQNAILDASHALQLVNGIQDIIRKYRSRHKVGNEVAVHLFVSAPTAFMFFLGRQGPALARIQLYEYDFGNTETYFPSIALHQG